MFRISRYALAHSFAHKHRFHRSRSPLRPPSVPPLSGDGNPLQPMFMNEILHQFISTNFEHLLTQFLSLKRWNRIAKDQNCSAQTMAH